MPRLRARTEASPAGAGAEPSTMASARHGWHAMRRSQAGAARTDRPRVQSSLIPLPRFVGVTARPRMTFRLDAWLLDKAARQKAILQLQIERNRKRSKQR